MGGVRARATRAGPLEGGARGHVGGGGLVVLVVGVLGELGLGGVIELVEGLSTGNVLDVVGVLKPEKSSAPSRPPFGFTKPGLGHRLSSGAVNSNTG